MNKIISLNISDHWCHVPGRQETNYTLEEWKNRTIPKELNAYGISDYSKCTRYDNNGTYRSENIIKCDQGWEFDHTWYDMTAPMQYYWVCDAKMIPVNTLALSRAGEVIGTLIFGQLADNYGRIPVFYITLTTMISGRIISIFTAQWEYLFIFFSFIGSLSAATIYQSTLIIALEISAVKRRAFIGMVVCYGWTVGMIIVPLFMWCLRDWMIFSLVTTLPCCLFFFCWPWIIESPRWLTFRGNTKRAIVQLRKITKANKAQLPSNIEELLTNLSNKQIEVKSSTILDLFTSLRLAKNTIILVYSSSIMFFIYMCFIYNIGNLSGNPYLNYTYQALGDLPAFIIAKHACDRFGRRLITSIAFFFIFFASFIITFTIQTEINYILINILTILIRMFANMTYYTLNLQGMEIYPTCIRQTGISLGIICSNVFAILSPYLVNYGLFVNAAVPYMVYAICALSACICSFFLPETLGHQLPETLQDGSIFGVDQDLWGRKKKRKANLENEAETPLNAE